jgi:peptide/nickel transport system substrate-binding protein
VKNSKVEVRSFADPESMGKALEDGDIDLMTRSMSPAQIDKLDDASGGNVDLNEMPGLEIRYLAFNTTAPSVKAQAVRQAMAQVIDRGELVGKVYGTQAAPLYSLVPATITGHSNSFFNKYGDPNVNRARNLLNKAAITTPVKITLHYTTDHYGTATAAEFKILKEQLNKSGLFDVTTQGTSWDKFVPAEREGKYDVWGMGWFPDFPDADNFLAPFLDKHNFLKSPYANSDIINNLIPASRREANRVSAAKSLTEIQDIVADEVPIIPLWQGKQFIAARDDITGAEWALNSSSTLQLWELSRGVSD